VGFLIEWGKVQITLKEIMRISQFVISSAHPEVRRLKF
jgi:hypothetical protein